MESLMPFYRAYRWLLLLPFLLLSGCGASLDDYRGQGPNWDLARFFNGNLVAHGLVTDRSGEVTSRFRVEMVGRCTLMMAASRPVPGI